MVRADSKAWVSFSAASCEIGTASLTVMGGGVGYSDICFFYLVEPGNMVLQVFISGVNELSITILCCLDLLNSS